MTQEARKQPAIDMKDRPILQVGIIVADATKTARRYAEFFKIEPWVFIDVFPSDVMLHGKPSGACGIRAAFGQVQDVQIELIQPLYGPSTWMNYLKEHGEGIHHLSFDMVDNHDQIVSALQAQGVGIEMQGHVGEVTFSYVATQKELGTIFEVVKPLPPDIPPAVLPWGSYTPARPGLISIEGKRIARIGIVVEDAEQTARHYQELLGIGPWSFSDVTSSQAADFTFRGITLMSPLPSTRTALARHRNIQLELLQPISGPSTYMDFLMTRGQGIHNINFGVVEDHDTLISLFASHGIGVEMTGTVNGTVSSYLASQNEFGGILGFSKP